MKTVTLAEIPLNFASKIDILEKIKKDTLSHDKFVHVVSVNPENIISSIGDKTFQDAILTAQIRIPDGVGTVWAAQTLGGKVVERVSGADLLVELMNWAGKMRLSTVLIGGRANLATDIAECYNQRYPQAKFIGLAGIFDIKNPQTEEEDKIFSIVRDIRPHLVFVAFGSPAQEKWIWTNKTVFNQSVCMGVGGGFDFLGGRVKRAPTVVRQFGLEWLWRLVIQPWRWRRQLRLIQFVILVIRSRFLYK